MTLLEDLDALDRMIENGAPKAEIRSQIRVIYNGVAALEEADSALIQDHAKLQQMHSQLQQPQPDPNEARFLGWQNPGTKPEG